MQNKFHMIDVGNKPITHRIAVASGEIAVGEAAFELIKNGKLPKGDVLVLAEIAGIQGAKKAYEMIPLCHPMGLDMVKIITELQPQTNSIKVFCIASVHAKTGIEMEVLAGATAALLTIWDLTKMVEPNLQISDVKLLAKKGGKSGIWFNPQGVDGWVAELISPPPAALLTGRKAAIITLSDRAFNGVYADESGEKIKQILGAAGAEIVAYKILPDEAEIVSKEVAEMVATTKPDLLITTGGTGVSERDITPEALRKLYSKEISGVGEFLRNDGAKFTPLSWSSRSISGVVERSLVISLPGNPRAVAEGLEALLPNLIPHLIRIIKGEK